jgi:quinol monooxygenase YgiN
MNRRTALFAGIVFGAAIPAMSFFALPDSAGEPPQTSSPAGGNDVFHVAIFRFAKEHIGDAVAAFHALASASRKDPGNLLYDIYREVDDDHEFCVVEYWASPDVLAAHERTESFIQYGQGLLAKYALLHDAVTARPFDIV